ncbi:unnamed protein product [Ceutorhynchus assimilis]|uniref:CCHC-type domain-containing protein n=1 Tax=Ceutorhynchus assimilis TaxID=467358 RepID=A0A9P0DZL6_9CUCU|nr:unnamed protein product [Ceutorhynchus assimilis]
MWRNHVKNKCPAAKWKCFKCNKFGHYRNLCPGTDKKPYIVGAMEQQELEQEDVYSEEVNSDLYNLSLNTLNVVSASDNSPHRLPLDVNKHTSAVTYMVKVSGKTVYKHVNNLRKLPFPEQNSQLQIPCDTVLPLAATVGAEMVMASPAVTHPVSSGSSNLSKSGTENENNDELDKAMAMPTSLGTPKNITGSSDSNISENSG